MGTHQDFEQAARDVKNLSKRPGDDTLLDLYALYKQGTEGDVHGARPGMLDIKGRRKFDAWSARKGMAKEVAKAEYVALVARLR